MFPVTTRHRGPVQHPSAKTLARTGPRARTNKYDGDIVTGQFQPPAGPPDNRITIFFATSKVVLMHQR
jgi:hypothetical protein